MKNGVIENLIENWLTKTDESGFQASFCQLLRTQGHKIIHVSRHGAHEQGKDIITINPEGIPCAYQLKVGRISFKDWGTIVRPEVEDLLDIPIKHPSIDLYSKHESWLVTTEELADQVRVNLDDRNKKRTHDGKMPLRTIVKGELISGLLDAHGLYFPTELNDLKIFLELYMSDGRSEFPKEKLSKFLLLTLPFSNPSLSRREASRAISSCILLTNYIVESFRKERNHWGVAEAWTIMIMHILALLEKIDADSDSEKQSIEEIESMIDQALSDLTKEAIERKELLSEDGLCDPLVYKYRTTILAGLICGHNLFKLVKKETIENIESNIRFIEDRLFPLFLWGESAVPSFLNTMWLFSILKKNKQRDEMLSYLISCYMQHYKKQSGLGLLNPYYGVDIAIRLETKTNKEPIFESFSHESYLLESLITLAARYKLRQLLSMNWRTISHIEFYEYIPKLKWENYIWHSEHGQLLSRVPKKTQSWALLIEESKKIDLEEIPKGLQTYPELLPLFFLIYPHRLRPTIVKRLDSLLLESKDL